MYVHMHIHVYHIGTEARKSIEHGIVAILCVHVFNSTNQFNSLHTHARCLGKPMASEALCEIPKVVNSTAQGAEP